MKKTAKHVFVIVRLDIFLMDLEPITNSITIKKVVLTEIEAEAEVQRLNKVNADKKCLYFWKMARLAEDEPASQSS